MSRLLSRQRYRDLLLGLGLLLAAGALVLWPNQAMEAARSGLALCGNVIIPSLFPFFVLSSLVVELGMSRYLGRLLQPVMAPLFRVNGACAAALALGIVGGYPVGARTAISLYQSVALVVYMLIPANTDGTLVLYDGDYSEVKVMHSMIKQLVEDKTDLTVEIKDQMSQVNNFNALRGPDPDCDLMFSYDGTVLTTFLGMDTTDIPEGMSLYDFVNQEVSRQEGLHMLGKVGLNNTYAIGVTQDVVDTYGVSTISDLVPIASQLRFGAEHEFFTEEGSMKYQPFVDFYGLKFQSATPVDVVLKYDAVERGSFDAMVVYTTDGLNKRAGLTILEDDRQFFPEYNGAILVRDDLFQDFADTAPELEQVLELLTGQVSNEDMVSMTYAIDVERQDVDQVAHDFLVERGLLEE